MLAWEKGQNQAIPEFQFHQFILHLHRALPSKNINNDKGTLFIRVRYKVDGPWNRRSLEIRTMKKPNWNAGKMFAFVDHCGQ